MNPTRISVIVSVSDQLANLEKILATLFSGYTLPEVIVVAEDGEDPGVQALLSRLAPTAPVRLLHRRQPKDGFRKAIVLNEALAAATGDYVVFLDGDCVPHRRFVADHAKLARPGHFVQGRRAYIAESSVPAFLEGRVTLARLFFAGRMSGRAKGFRLPVPRVSADTALRGTLGCNFGAWRADIVAVNGFDEAFVGWGKEDSDLAARLLHLGRRRLMVHNHAVVYHLNHPLASRTGLNPNERRLAETLATRRVRCDKGLDGHTAGHPASP